MISLKTAETTSHLYMQYVITVRADKRIQSARYTRLLCTFDIGGKEGAFKTIETQNTTHICALSTEKNENGNENIHMRYRMHAKSISHTPHGIPFDSFLAITAVKTGTNNQPPLTLCLNIFVLFSFSLFRSFIPNQCMG